MIVIQDENANRDNEIAAIFNPKRVRTPSVVVTGESPNGPASPFAVMTNMANQITHSDSVTSSQPDGAESLTGVIIGDHIDHHHQQPNSLTSAHQNQLPRSASTEHEKPKGCKGSCCSELAQKVSNMQVSLKLLLTLVPSDVLWCLCDHLNHLLLGWHDPLFQVSVYAFNQIASFVLNDIPEWQCYASLASNNATHLIAILVVDGLHDARHGNRRQYVVQRERNDNETTRRSARAAAAAIQSAILRQLVLHELCHSLLSHLPHVSWHGEALWCHNRNTRRHSTRLQGSRIHHWALHQSVHHFLHSVGDDHLLVH